MANRELSSPALSLPRTSAAEQRRRPVRRRDGSNSLTDRELMKERNKEFAIFEVLPRVASG
jgi:hypothetical protein